MPSIYDIMIEMNLDDKVTEGLKGIGESFSRLLEQLESLHEGLNAALIGGAAIGMALGLNKLASAADELSDSLAKLSVAGQDVEEAMTAAERATTAVPGTTTGMNVELLRRLTPLMGAEGAARNLPGLSMADYWERQYGHPEAVEQFARMARQRGLEGPEAMRFIEQMTKVQQAYGKAFDPQQMSNFMRRSGTFGAGVDEGFLTGTLPYLMSTMGAGREQIGTNMARMMESLQKPGKLGGAISGKAWQDYVASAQTGLGFGASRGAQLFAQDPDAWMARLGDALKKKFGDDPNTLRDIARKLFTSPVMAELATLMWTQMPRIAEARARVEGRPGFDEAGQEDYIRRNALALKDAISRQIAEMFEALAVDVQPIYLKQLNWVWESLKDINEKIKGLDSRQIQLVFEAVEGLIAALGAAAAVRIGALLLGGTAAPIVLAAGAIATVLYLLGEAKWTETATGFQIMQRAIDSFLDWLGKKVYEVEQAFGFQTYGFGRGAGMTGSFGGVPDQAIGPGVGFWGSARDWPTDYGFRRPDIADKFMPPGSFGGNLDVFAPPGTGFWGSPGALMRQQPNLLTPGTGMPVPEQQPSIRDYLPEMFRLKNGPWPTAPADVPVVPMAPSSTSSMPSFTPALPRTEQNASVNVQLNIDGRALGQVMLDRLLSMAEFSDTGSGANWNAAYPMTDGNYRG